MRTGALFRATCCAKPGLRTEDVSADDLDLDCSAAATDVLNRARDEELLIASLESSLKVSQAVAAALTAMADERAGEPSRKARRIRLVHDDSDGEMMATDADDVEEPAPAAADVEQPVPATPAGLFSDVFGNPDAG